MAKSDPTRYPIVMKTKQNFLVDDFFKFVSIKNNKGESFFSFNFTIVENVEPYSIKKTSLKYSG